MGVGLILFWPALFMLKGDGPEQQELAMLKGEYDAVNQAAIRNNCGLVPGQPVSGATLSASLGDTNVKPNLGLSGSTITGSSTAAISMNDPHGAFVSAVTRDGNAAKAGLVPGDIIEAFNGHRVVSIEDLNNFVSQSQSGSTVKLDVYRRGVVLAVEAKL
jgi:S1-C subfamily serine protease